MALSRKNPRLQQASRLARSAAERAATGLFVIEGPKLVGEALDAGLNLTEAFVAPSFAGRPGAAEVLRALASRRVPVTEAEERAIAALSDVQTSQGIVAIARPHPSSDAARLLDVPGDLLLASAVQDPGNAGALVRIAAAAGFAGVVADKQTADFLAPKVVRGSAGAVLRLPTARVDDLAAYAGALRTRGVEVLAAATRGGEDPSAYARRGRIALVMGSEGSGLSPELEKACTAALTIPLAGRVESLNVATAAAVLAFSLARNPPLAGR